MSSKLRVPGLLAAWLVCTASAPSWALFKGDLDGDGRSDPADVALLVLALDGRLSLTAAQLDAADVNLIDPATGVPDGDGVVDRRDLAVLSAAVVGGDPDQDGLTTSFENDLLFSFAWNKFTFSATLDDGVYDADGDGLTNAEELPLGTNPWLEDTDFDGMPDSWEVQFGLDPLDASDAAFDPDADGLANGAEFDRGTDPTTADTDQDGLVDGEEALSPPFTNPVLWDTDGDLLGDGFEQTHGFNPLADFFQTYVDSDGDQLDNLEEQGEGTDPWLADSDGDGYGDGDEVFQGSDPTDAADPPASLDYDLDGVTDLADNCMRTANAGQADADSDGFGDACDACPGDDAALDPDRDGLCGALDKCPLWASPDNGDLDGNGVGDPCECGDVQGDGDVDTADLDALQDALELDDVTTLAAVHKCDFDGDAICTYDDWLLLAGYLGGATVERVCADQSKLIEHVLGRVSYGGGDYDRRVIAEKGIAGYLQEQLDPPVPGIDDALEAKLDLYRFGTYPVLDQPWSQLNTNYNVFLEGEQLDSYARISWDHAEMKLLRSIYTRRGLTAVLRDLFFNHFNTDANQLYPAFSTGLMDEYAIAPRVFGPFEDLVHAVAESDAMLWYLNQNKSKASDVNENFGRELLELHTIGQGPDEARHYSETDVQEVTRILTGYGWGGFHGEYQQFRLYKPWIVGEVLHDVGEKTVTLNGLLGDGPGQEPAWHFPAGNLGTQADNEGWDLIRLLSRHPYTAERVGEKLVRRLVSENPPPAVVAAAVSEWTDPAVPGTPQGDLRSVLAVILQRPEFLDAAYVRDKTKRPLQYAASVVRALGEGVEGGSSHHDQPASFPTFLQSYNGIMGDLWLMGETLYRVGPPTGLPEDSASWTGAGALLARFNLAHRLASAVAAPQARWGVSHTDSDEALVDGLVAALAPAGVRAVEKQAIVSALAARRSAGQQAGTWDVDDEYERIAYAAALVLSTPGFLLH